LLKPSAGSIHFNGTDLSHLSPQKGNQWRAEHLGFVFQKHLLLPELNLLENTCLPLAKSKGWSREVLQRGEEVLKNLGLEHRINALPSKLSGGEAQRGAIARALVHHPTLLLLDEPTGNLDPSMSTELMKQILSISKSKGITCITVTHNLELAQTMDRHGRMLDHRLVE
jgi:ABC-type lipoprotein export system ATPase subunit